VIDLLVWPLLVGALFLPGLWWPRGTDPLARLGVAACLGALAWGALGLARFFWLLPPGMPRAVGLISLVAAVGGGVALARLAGKGLPAPASMAVPPALWTVVAGVAALTLGLEAVVPHYGVAFFYYDWWMHFDLAGFYRAPADFGRVYEEGATITSRTPLFHLLGGLALALFGPRFSIFQVLTAAVGWLWVLPFARLALRLSRAPVVPLVALVGLSPLVLFSHTYAWPKGLVAFFLLLAVDRALTLREAAATPGTLAVQLGLAGGAAILAHNGFVGYLLPLYALLAWDAWRGRGRWRNFAVAGLTAALVLAPWYAWAGAQYGWHAALLGYPRPPSASVLAWGLDHLVILATAILPVGFVVDRLTGSMDPLQGVFLVYLGTAAGLLGVGFLFRTLAQLVPVRAVSLGPQRALIVAFAITGTVSTVLLLDKVHIGTANNVLIPALLVVALLALGRAPLSLGALLLALAEMLVVQALVLAWLWSAAADAQPNAQLAVAHEVRFLAHDAWPAGVALLAAGLAACLLSLLSAARAARSASSYPTWRPRFTPGA
jgi:hypothetical protein